MYVSGHSPRNRNSRRKSVGAQLGQFLCISYNLFRIIMKHTVVVRSIYCYKYDSLSDNTII